MNPLTVMSTTNSIGVPPSGTAKDIEPVSSAGIGTSGGHMMPLIHNAESPMSTRNKVRSKVRLHPAPSGTPGFAVVPSGRHSVGPRQNGSTTKAKGAQNEDRRPNG